MEQKIVQTQQAQAAPDMRAEQDDRRGYIRVAESGLVAIINDKLVDVVDISVTGLRLSHGCDTHGAEVSFTLMAVSEHHLDVNHSIRTSGTVTRIDPQDQSVAIVFDRISLALAKMIVASKSRQLGVTPFLVR